MLFYSNRKVLGSTPDRSTWISFFRVCLCHIPEKKKTRKKTTKNGYHDGSDDHHHIKGNVRGIHFGTFPCRPLQNNNVK